MMRDIDTMIYQLSQNGDAVAVDLSSTDCIVSALTTKRIKGMVTADGTIIKIDKLNSDGTTVVMYLPAPNWNGVDGITKIYKTGTDATKITLITE
jgi:hypothetical protein